MPISCGDNTFREYIDHLVVDRRVVPWVDGTSFRHVTYPQGTKRSGTRSRATVRGWLSCGSGNEVVAGEDDKGC